MAKVFAFDLFTRRAKRLSRKFKTLPAEIMKLADSLAENPEQGIPLGSGLYKLRLASESKGKGKRGGFRVITYYLQKDVTGDALYLVTIYDKSQEASISKSTLEAFIKEELDDL